jgi:hypothetical protein
MDFSPYGVKTRYEAGRAAVDAHFEKRSKTRSVAGISDSGRKKASGRTRKTFDDSRVPSEDLMPA